MIDFNAIRAMAENKRDTQLNQVIQDPLEGLSDIAREQKVRDDRRDARKEQRDAARVEVLVTEAKAELAKAEEVSADAEAFYAAQSYKSQLRARGGSIMAQLSDLHFGCTVKGLEERKDANVYNLDVAAHRLATYAQQVIFYGVAHRAEECVIALTGDIFDSKIGKERNDKILNSETTATQSYLRGRDLIIQFIETIRHSEVFGSIRVVGISGNEARLYADRGHSHIMAADNWDSLLNADLASRYIGSDVETDFGVNRYVAEVQGWRVLLLHGDQGIDSKLSQTKVQSVLGTHNADFGISGHIHDTLVTGKWIRSASLVGTDFYAGDGLALEGRATQNIFWLSEGQRNTYAVDLQTPDPAVEPFKMFDYRGAFGAS